MSGSIDGLRGCRILVAEDEYMIADEIEGVLSEAGVEVVGPVSRVAKALDIARSGERLDGAVLDVNLADEAIWPVAAVLVARGVPVVLTTGYDPSAIPAEYANLARCAKPAEARVVAQVLAQSIAACRTAGFFDAHDDPLPAS